MAELPATPQLEDFQRYVAAIEVERGFDAQGPIEKCLLLGEETGELFKAVRTQEGLPIETSGGAVADELADIFIYLCAIANRYDIDLEKAFRAKEERNAKRTWR